MIKITNNAAQLKVTDKIDEFNRKIETIKADETLSKNTRQTRSYNLRKEVHYLQVIAYLLEGYTDGEMELPDVFAQLTTPAAEVKHYDAVVVNKGDNILALLQKYSDRKDPLAKIQAAAEKAGLTVNMGTGIIE